MKPRSEQGAAILMAMLTVAVVASVATAAVMQQWKLVQTEVGERERVQAQWLLRGALDWSRLLLRQDAQSGGANSADHLSEPWALPLHETQLSAFVTAHQGVSDASAATVHAMLSGGMSDLQGRLNVLNLVHQSEENRAVPLQRLFERLGLPPAQLQLLRQGLAQAQQPDGALLMPVTLADLAWLGLAPETLAALAPYAALIPASTEVNLNTASAEVIWASVPDMAWSQALALVSARQQGHFTSVADAFRRVKLEAPTTGLAVRSRFFSALGRLQMDETRVALGAQLQRAGPVVTPLYVAVQPFGAQP